MKSTMCDRVLLENIRLASSILGAHTDILEINGLRIFGCWRQANLNFMTDAFEIKKTDELIEYLKKNGKKDPFESFDYQLPTNYCWIYELANGQIICIENSFRYGGLIFRDKGCFDQIVKSDRFPIENPEKGMYEKEIERIKTIHKQIDFFRQHLNNTLKFDFSEVTREAAQFYIKKIIGRSIKKLTTDLDLIALVSVFGEVVRREINGKWILEKWYGAFNPYFIPKVINNKNKILSITDSVLISVKWKVSHVDSIFNDTEGLMNLSEVIKHRECMVLT